MSSIACGLALVGTTACAQADDPNPYFIGARLAYRHDSNLLREAGSPGDSYYSIGLLGGFDQAIGRQRVYANANLNNNRFQNQKQFNNNSYGVVAGIDWSTIGKVSGLVQVSTDQSLASFGATNGIATSREKNLQTSSEFRTVVRYGTVSLLSIEGGLTRRILDYSAPLFAPSAFDQTAYSIGLKYRPSGALTLGSALRLTREHYPDRANGNGNGVDFDRRDIDFTANWIPTGLSSISARISTGKRESDAASALDFSGVTGLFQWTYRPTGKLTFNTTLTRDTGAETNFVRDANNQPLVAGDTSRLTTALRTGASYAATSKIRANAALTFISRDYETSNTGFSGANGGDKYRAVSLGADYAPTRALSLSCDVSRGRTTVSNNSAANYNLSIYGCSATFTIQ